MGGIATISDPTGTNGGTATSNRYVVDLIASSAIADKDLVAITIDDDGNLTGAPADTDTHDPAVKCGVATKAAAASEICPVVVYGPAIVNTPATGPSVSEKMILTSTAGVADGVAADATTVAGDVHGTFLTDEIGTTNTCWVWVGE